MHQSEIDPPPPPKKAPKCILYSRPKCILYSRPKCILYSRPKCILYSRPKCILYSRYRLPSSIINFPGSRIINSTRVLLDHELEAIFLVLLLDNVSY